MAEKLNKVLSNVTQTLTDSEKAKARANIGAADAAEVKIPINFDVQLNENPGGISSDIIISYNGEVISGTDAFDLVTEAVEDHRPVMMTVRPYGDDEPWVNPNVVNTKAWYPIVMYLTGRTSVPFGANVIVYSFTAFDDYCNWSVTIHSTGDIGCYSEAVASRLWAINNFVEKSDSGNFPKIGYISGSIDVTLTNQGSYDLILDQPEPELRLFKVKLPSNATSSEVNLKLIRSSNGEMMSIIEFYREGSTCAGVVMKWKDETGTLVSNEIYWSSPERKYRYLVYGKKVNVSGSNMDLFRVTEYPTERISSSQIYGPGGSV